jgi:hypothetical protein
MARAWMFPEECWRWREDGDGAQAFQMARQVTSAGKASLSAIDVIAISLARERSQCLKRILYLLWRGDPSCSAQRQHIWNRGRELAQLIGKDGG